MRPPIHKPFEHGGAPRIRAVPGTVAALALMACALVAEQAHAVEPVALGEPDVLRETAEVVGVVDAFDGQDSFDADLSVGIVQSWKSATITRESHIAAPQFSGGGYTSNSLEVARSAQRTTRLETRLDVGLYRDLGVFARVPLVLADDRQLDGLGSSLDTQDLALEGAPGEQLFNLPFRSPTRRGVEYLAVGVRFSPFNQWRDASKPTWTIAVEGRFSVAPPLHACNPKAAAGQRVCADPADVNRNGVAGEGPLEGSSFQGSRRAGISRGTTALAFESVLSKRLRAIEPYAGIRGLFEFQNADSDFGGGDARGALVNHPPIEGSLDLGLALYPLEAVERRQRLEVDLRVSGTYRSEGRDYSELFDALGSSDAASLREPRYSRYRDNRVGGALDPNEPSVIDPNSQKVYMTGITDVQQHGIYKLSARVTWTAKSFFKLSLGGSAGYVQGHGITADQACNPNLTSDLGSAGPCRGTSGTAGNGLLSAEGVPNPNYRDVINSAGRRFYVRDAFLLDAWLYATVLF